MSSFERVSYVDVILEICRLFGLHSWSVSHFGRHYSSLLRILTSILTRVPFGRHYSGVSRMWTSFLKRVAYLGFILEPFLIWTSLFKFVAYLDIVLEVCRDIQKNENSWLTLCMWHLSYLTSSSMGRSLTTECTAALGLLCCIIPLQLYLYSYVFLMQMNVKAEKTCQMSFEKYVFRGSTPFHSCWMSFKTLLW
jgi:hypothetical protein